MQFRQLRNTITKKNDPGAIILRAGFYFESISHLAFLTQSPPVVAL